MNLKHFYGLTAACLLASAVLAGEAAPVPVVVAESETFEAVGRLEAEGMSWFIDRADSNAPVLNAALEVEANGKTVKAVFRPERGDYLIADEAWLKPLRAKGEYALALTLLAGEESDLLTADLHVEAPASALGVAPGLSGTAWVAGGAGLLAGLLLWRLRRSRKGDLS